MSIIGVKPDIHADISFVPTELVRSIRSHPTGICNDGFGDDTTLPKSLRLGIRLLAWNYKKSTNYYNQCCPSKNMIYDYCCATGFI